MMTCNGFLAVALMVVLCSNAVAGQEGMVPFFIPAKANPDSLIRMDPPGPITPQSPRVVAAGEQFQVDGRPLRVLGVSMGYAAPSHEDSEKIAARLAQGGVNCVRFHGIEGHDYWGKEGLNKDQADTLDRFDYFLHQLAEHGVYSNLNLHVSRQYSTEVGLPASKVWFGDKIVDIFTPKIIEAQKDFARRLLAHVNPYRKARYADDPAVAFVEINNEDSLFIWDSEEKLPQLDKYYADLLAELYNAYLKRRYGETPKLRTAWGDGLDADESVESGTVRLYPKERPESDRRKVDRLLCLLELEQAYWDGMYKVVKEEAKCQALVTGTIIFGDCNLYAQRNMDYIDCHAYWGHPRWAKGVSRWDSEKWTVPSAAMTDSPHETVTDLDTLSGLMFYMASQQFENKPYTNSEYNHCAPNDYQAECVPLMSSFGAAQGWDGIWWFMYGTDAEKDRIHWFDIDANPAKWGFMQTAAAMFRDGGVAPFAKTRLISYCGTETPLEDLARAQLKYNYDTFKMLQDRSGVTWKDFLDTRLVTNLAGRELAPAATPAQGDSTRITWDLAPNGHGRYELVSDGGLVWIGHADRLDGQSNLLLKDPRWAVVTVAPLDGKALGESAKVLVTGMFRCENTGMKHNEARDSVGKDWGGTPALIETIDATISGLGFLKGDWRCDALSADGSASAEVPLAADSATGLLKLEMSRKYNTMWYLLRKK